jgi:hypothetical protein
MSIGIFNPGTCRTTFVFVKDSTFLAYYSCRGIIRILRMYKTAIVYTLNMKATGSFYCLVNDYQITRRYIPDGCSLNIHRHKNIFHIILKWMWNKWCILMWTESMYTRIGLSISLLWTRWWTSGLHKKLSNSQILKKDIASWSYINSKFIHIFRY